jgi:hypothetical protein
MAVSNTINRVQYAGNGVATEFAVSFPFLDEEDLEVTLTDSGGDAATRPWAPTTPCPGPARNFGTVTYPLVRRAQPSGEKLTIRRVLRWYRTWTCGGRRLQQRHLEKQLTSGVMASSTRRRLTAGRRCPVPRTPPRTTWATARQPKRPRRS